MTGMSLVGMNQFDKAAAYFDALSREEEQSALMESMLSIVDSLMTYRRRFRRGLEVADLLELVLYDESNPRSIAYQVSRVEEHVNGLPSVQSRENHMAGERCLYRHGGSLFVPDFAYQNNIRIMP